jgi:hypothetical protein
MNPRHERLPGGISLGRALIISPGLVNDDLREVVALIDRVHGDGALPAIPLSFVSVIVNSSGRPADGVFAADEDDQGELHPLAIRVRGAAPHRHFVTIHEIGHFLDLMGLPGVGYSSDAHESLTTWRRAIFRSRAFGELERLVDASDPEVADRATVLLKTSELWARTYAQFVAVRSGSPILERSLSALRQRSGSVYLPRQWDDHDFVTIERAIEGLFQNLGWITS